MINNFAFIWGLIFLPLPIFIYLFWPANKSAVGDGIFFPILNEVKKINSNVKTFGFKATKYHFWKYFLLYLVWVCLCFSLARPQWVGDLINSNNQGRDILFAVDISKSMTAEDFKYKNNKITRLDAIKKTIDEFIDKRVEDRFGLVLFGSQAYLQAPISFDHKSVKEILWIMQAGMAGSQTAIGDAIGVGVKVLKDNEKIKDKVIVLLTDGENNSGSLTTEQALNLAKDEGIKIYTIGVGAEELMINSLFGLRKINPSEGLDEKTLEKIATKTNGKYFRALDFEGLKEIYNEINKLEMIEGEDKLVRPVKELFYIPLFIALLLSVVLMIIIGLEGDGK